MWPPDLTSERVPTSTFSVVVFPIVLSDLSVNRALVIIESAPPPSLIEPVERNSMFPLPAFIVAISMSPVSPMKIPPVPVDAVAVRAPAKFTLIS